MKVKEFEEIKSYILITFDNFSPNRRDPKFMDCTVNFDIICYDDEWDLDGFRTRPLVIAGYIDGILNNAKLSGIGTLNFIGMNEIILDENLCGYCLMYSAVHGADDLIEAE